MRQDTLQAYISKERTYEIYCPQCSQAQLFHVSDVPANRSNPFTYDCTCGRAWTIQLVGWRSTPRKPVDLAASFFRVADPRNVRIVATVVDLSVRGLRLSTEAVRDLTRNEILKISFTLDDKRRSKIDVFAKIRRLTSGRAHLTIAVEFLPLTLRAREILEAYTDA